MKITVPVVIEVDPATWAHATGICDAQGRYTLAAVRDDIRSYVLNQLHHLPRFEETDAEVNPS
jgi:hypothetical protein